MSPGPRRPCPVAETAPSMAGGAFRPPRPIPPLSIPSARVASRIAIRRGDVMTDETQSHPASVEGHRCEDVLARRWVSARSAPRSSPRKARMARRASSGCRRPTSAPIRPPCWSRSTTRRRRWARCCTHATSRSIISAATRAHWPTCSRASPQPRALPASRAAAGAR